MKPSTLWGHVARRVFFSFHYQYDIWRVNQIRNSHVVEGCAAAGFQDASLWEEAMRKGDAAIRRMIDNGLHNTTVTAVLIGTYTASRPYVDYEIQQSIDRGNGILGVRIHHLRDSSGYPSLPGPTPSRLVSSGYPVYDWTNAADFGRWVEQVFQDAERRRQYRSYF